MIQLNDDLLTEHTPKALLALGGRQPDSTWLKAYMKKYHFDLIIAADRGASFLIDNGYKPHMVVGVFGCLSKSHLQHLIDADIPQMQLPAKKDDTDAEIALQEIAKRGQYEVILLGALGGRIDHEMALLTRVSQSCSEGFSYIIADEMQSIRGLNVNLYHLPGLKERYYSIVSFSENLTLSYRGMQYPLEKKLLPFGSALGVSNEAMEDSLSIEVHSGKGLLCITKKE